MIQTKEEFFLAEMGINPQATIEGDYNATYKLKDLLKQYTEQCNIAVVSKRVIELTRDDLVKFKSDLPIDEISIYDFKGSAMSREEMYKADLITFKDGEQIKELKNRYRVW